MISAILIGTISKENNGCGCKIGENKPKAAKCACYTKCRQWIQLISSVTDICDSQETVAAAMVKYDDSGLFV
jgi:hypothetical protein